jgi:hypothetical protein
MRIKTLGRRVAGAHQLEHIGLPDFGVSHRELPDRLLPGRIRCTATLVGRRSPDAAL